MRDEVQISSRIQQSPEAARGSWWRTEISTASNVSQVYTRYIPGIHPGFETQGRRHQKSKTGVSVAPQKGLVSYKFFLKKKKKKKSIYPVLLTSSVTTNTRLLGTDFLSSELLKSSTTMSTCLQLKVSFALFYSF